MQAAIRSRAVGIAVIGTWYLDRSMSPEAFFQKLQQVILHDGRYPLAAYAFLHDGLEYSSQKRRGDPEDACEKRHVSGGDLCNDLAEFARQRWGALALTVLEGWNIRSTRDFGEMVYVLVEAGLLMVQQSDRPEDFHDVYSFQDMFGGYELPLAAFDEPNCADADVVNPA